MTPAARIPRPIRLFLDSGVIIEGCTASWGAAKAVLIIATLRTRFTVVLARAVEDEVTALTRRMAAARRTARPTELPDAIVDWSRRVRVEGIPPPPPELVSSRVADLLPVLRHANDLPLVISAILAQPDWVILSNSEHWNQKLAIQTGLRIATPREFLEHRRLEG